MNDIIKQVQEACADVCDHMQSDDGAMAAMSIRALDLSHLTGPRCACGDSFTEDAMCANCLAAKDSASPPTGWQDISTAPKDGTDVLLSMPYGMPPRVAGYFKDGWYSFDRPDDEIKDPSHWMPLPIPPKPSK
ncbi:hypothetical protein [Aquitalea sp. USM4]|uniref:hypothetical protein n=1 Tax=Aquitalea sp. USM4 TaxID=1590041 RepID=UPI00103AAE66|nr:hypothetical protein [Aquitalea sp. USM4]QBJ80485.1 hypothetical protein DKK66_19750 [Aquitalea sp. USM4]